MRGQNGADGGAADAKRRAELRLGWQARGFRQELEATVEGVLEDGVLFRHDCIDRM